jgi:hypothetical protein
MQPDLRRSVEPVKLWRSHVAATATHAMSQSYARSSLMDCVVIGRAFARRVGSQCGCLVRALVQTSSGSHKFARCQAGRWLNRIRLKPNSVEDISRRILLQAAAGKPLPGGGS